jgi:hypothetical protein
MNFIVKGNPMCGGERTTEENAAGGRCAAGVFRRAGLANAYAGAATPGPEERIPFPPRTVVVLMPSGT